MLYSIRAAKLTPSEYLDYPAQIGAGVEQFSIVILGASVLRVTIGNDAERPQVDPHTALEILGPCAHSSHVHDTATWRLPDGVATRGVNMGEGNVGIDAWIEKFVRMRPESEVSIENILMPVPIVYRNFELATFKTFAAMTASELAAFLAIAERGTPVPASTGWIDNHRARRATKPHGLPRDRDRPTTRTNDAFRDIVGRCRAA